MIIGIATTETGEQHFFVTKQLTHSLSSECAVLTPSLNLNFTDAIFTFLRVMKFFFFSPVKVTLISVLGSCS